MEPAICQSQFSGFSVSESQREEVIKYIAAREEHHRRRGFQEEYLDCLRVNKIEYDERFVLD